MKKEKTFDNSNITTNSTQLAILTKNFPQCFDKNGDFMPHKMQEVVAKEGVNLSKESYSLNWLGKSYARLLANEQPLTLLKEDTQHNQKTQNINSENLLIKGDNLEVLKHLRRAYSEQVKMIYIDPPYNTGSDGFVYQDARKFTTEQLQHLAGIDEDEAQRILNFTASHSNSHSAWLTFIYPRLYIARELLSDDGVIFISIDDNEQAQLKMLCDEIFGEENFVGNFIINSTPNARDYGHIGKMHENVIFYSKKDIKTQTNLIKEKEKLFKYKDRISGFNIHPLYNSNTAFTSNNRPNLYYPFFLNPNKKDDGFYEISLTKQKNFIEIFPAKSQKENIQFVWRWGYQKAEEELNKEIVGYRNKDGGFRVVQKMRHSEKLIRSLLIDKEFSSRRGTSEVEMLFNAKIFSFPKPLNLIKKFIEISSNKNDTILDFFAGSGTTADAVMQLNAEDGGNRKCISVQIAEPINEAKNKTAYDFVKDELKQETPTIFDITKERILRAGAKIQKDNQESKEPKDLSKQDFGFKVFETLPMFEGFFDEMDEFGQVDMFDGTKLSDEDLQILLTSWMVNDGIKLTCPARTITLDNYESYYADRNLYLMYKDFTTDDLRALLEKLDNDKDFEPNKIILFGYNFLSKHQREISEALKSYSNKKGIELDRVLRY